MIMAGMTVKDDASSPQQQERKKPMIALTNVPPAFCPGCGRPTHLDEHLLLNAGFECHCAYTCQACGSMIQLADQDRMVETACESGGDLKFHLKP